MGSFSFKSSGTLRSDATSNARAVTAPPIGVATPLSLGDSGLLKMHYDIGAQLADNLRNLIMTNWGERLGFYDYGANLRPLMVDIVSLDDFDTEALERIRAAVQRWMPYVELIDYVSEPSRNLGTAGSISAVSLVITYNIASINLLDKKIRVTLFAI